MLPPLQPNYRQSYVDPQDDPRSQPKPAAFLLSSNVQDTYSAYRLNGNMGLAPYNQPKSIKDRIGFFGEKPNLDEPVRKNDRGHTVSLPMIQHSASNYQLPTYSPLPGQLLPNQFFPQSVGQPQSIQFGYPPPIQQDRPTSFQAPMMVPLPPLPVVISAMFPGQLEKRIRKKRREENLEFYEKLIIDQNKHLKKVARQIGRQFQDVFDTDTIKSKARRLKTNNLRQATPPPDISILSDHDQSILSRQKKNRSKSPIASPDTIPDTILDSPGSPKSRNSPNSPNSPRSPVESNSPMTKRMKKLAKAQRPLHLYQILWVLVYHTLLKKDAEERVADRKGKVEQGSLKKTQEQKNHLMELINKNCMVQLQEIYKLKKALVIVNEGAPKEKPVSLKDRQKNFSQLIGKVTAVMQTLNSAISLQSVPKSVITFLEGLTREKAVIPPKLLTEFELSRLEVSQFGTLKNVNEMRCKMLLSLFVIVRVLIFTCLVNPWVATDQVKESVILVKNLKNCSSILYHIIMDYLRENVEPVKDNQKHIAPEKRIVPTKSPLLVFSSHNANSKKATDEEAAQEVLIGLYSRDVLSEYLDSSIEGLDKLKQMFGECADKLYFLIPKGRE